MIYTEIYNFPQSQKVNDNLSSSALSFSGNGILNRIEISATGNSHAIPREDNTNSVIGRTFFSSIENGSASCDFKGIWKVINNVKIT